MITRFTIATRDDSRGDRQKGFGRRLWLRSLHKALGCGDLHFCPNNWKSEEALKPNCGDDLIIGIGIGCPFEPSVS